MKTPIALALAVLSLDAFAAGTRTRAQARLETSDLTVASVEALEQYGSAPEYPAAAITALEAEIKSCGITYNGPSCLDSGFENFGNAGVRDVDTTDRTGYVFFSRFKKKGDARILLMAVIANKDKDKPAFRTANVWALTPGRERPEVYVADFLKCTASEGVDCQLRPLLAYDPITGTAEETALNDLEGVRTVFARDARRFFHAAEVAATFRRATLDRAVRALGARSDVVTRSGNAVYRQAFFNLVQTKFAAFPDLVADVAREVGGVAAVGSLEQLQATIVAANAGDRSAATLNTLYTGALNARLPAGDRREALVVYAKLATTPAEQDKVLILLGSTEQALRSASYVAVGDMVLTEESLPTLERLLVNPAPNIRGNAVKALARVPGMQAMQRMAVMIKDKSVDVATSATENLTAALTATDGITTPDFISFMENSIVGAVAANARDQRVLTQTLIPARAQLLDLAFGKILAQERTVLEALKVSAANRLIAVRVEAISFIAKLGSNEATVALINLLSDANPLVGASTVGALNGRLISDANIDLLFRVSVNANVVVRQNAVAVIGKVQTKKALQALIRKSQENIDSTSWKVRRDVATLLGGYYVAEATATLVTMLNEVHAEVRTAAFDQLAKGDRLLDETQVQRIGALIRSPIALVPTRAVILLAQANTIGSIAIVTGLTDPSLKKELQLEVLAGLGAVEGETTTTLLISFLTDDDAPVRALADAALTTRTLSAGQLALLAPALASAELSIRQAAVKQLVRSEDGAALALLQGQAAVEPDAVLKAEIDAAVATKTSGVVTVEVVTL